MQNAMKSGLEIPADWSGNFRLSVSWGFQRLPLVTLLVSISFLQGYAIRFWVGLLGSPGWAVSMGLELLHLWFWNRAAVSAGRSRIGWATLALVATGLLLAGAIHEVARPLLQERERTDSQVQQRAVLEEETAVLKANLVAYREMAAGQGRRGWQEEIRRDTERLAQITQKFRELSTRPANSSRVSGALVVPWLNGLMVWVVVAVAVLFQIGVILAVWSLSGNHSASRNSFRPSVLPSRNAPATISAVSEISAESRNAAATISPISETPETFRRNPKCPETDFYKELWAAIEAHRGNGTASLAKNGSQPSQAQLARHLGVSPPDLSAIKLLAAGAQLDRKPARASVVMLAKKFGLHMPK